MAVRYLTSLLLAIICLASCEQPDAPPPGNIPSATMEKILYDMQLADVYSQSVRKDSTEHLGQKNQDSLARYYNEIFAHHKVTYEQFKTSMQWYKEHPLHLDTIYTNVLTRISKVEDDIRNMTPKPAPKPDSTSAAPVL